MFTNRSWRRPVYPRPCGQAKWVSLDRPRKRISRLNTSTVYKTVEEPPDSFQRTQISTYAATAW